MFVLMIHRKSLISLTNKALLSLGMLFLSLLPFVMDYLSFLDLKLPI